MSVPATSAEAPAAHPARNPWAVLAVLCLGLFMILLDGTIVNIAIPRIMTSFGTGLSNVEWVMNAYVLAFAVLLVTLGRFGDLYGRRRLFVAGMALFTLASLACGLAPSIDWLIAFRVVQGAGGAAMGIWGGVIGVLLALRIVPESKNPTAVESLDLPGVGLISASLFCLTFALVEGLSSGGMQMGMPKGGGTVPAIAQKMMEVMFKGWFTDAINTTFIVGVAFAFVGGLCALLLRSRPKEARDRADETAPGVSAEPAVAVARSGDT